MPLHLYYIKDWETSPPRSMVWTGHLTYSVSKVSRREGGEDGPGVPGKPILPTTRRYRPSVRFGLHVLEAIEYVPFRQEF